MQFGLYNSVFGQVLIQLEGNELFGLDFVELKGKPISSKLGKMTLGNSTLVDKVLEAIATNVVKDIPITLFGSKFQRDVWQALRDIPVGKVATYKEIAASIGSPKAFRAVANACGANPMPIIVPCHRAIRSDGSIGGFALGDEMKKTLLKRELLGVLS